MFQAKDGTNTIHQCIIGERKNIGDEGANDWGHKSGQVVVEIVYHDYNPPPEYNANANNPWGSGRVTNITTIGNYYSQ